MSKYLETYQASISDRKRSPGAGGGSLTGSTAHRDPRRVAAAVLSLVRRRNHQSLRSCLSPNAEIMLCDAKGPDPWSSKPDRLVLAFVVLQRHHQPRVPYATYPPSLNTSPYGLSADIPLSRLVP